MFEAAYLLWRTYALDSTTLFVILSATQYVLFGPRKRPHVGPLPYLLLSAAAFSVLFQQVLLANLGKGVLIFDDHAHYLYFFMCQLGLCLLLSSLLLEGDVYSKLLYVTVQVALIQMYRGASLPLYALEGTLEPHLYMAADLASAFVLYLLLIGVATLFVRYRVRITIRIGARMRLAFCYVLLSLLLAIMLPGYYPEGHWGPIACALIMSDVPLIYYLFARFTQSAEERREMDVALERARAEELSYERYLRLQEQVRVERHELTNTYFRLLVLLREGDLTTLETELEDRLDTIARGRPAIECGSAYLDYLLEERVARAREADIPFAVEIQGACCTGVDEVAAGTVLANLIDNALEASASVVAPEVSVRLTRAHAHLLGTVKNRIDQKTLSRNPGLATTKADASRHGFGLRIVRHTCDEADGTFDLSVEDGFFVATFMLPCER